MKITSAARIHAIIAEATEVYFVEPQVDSLVWRRLQASSLTENRKARMNKRRPAQSYYYLHFRLKVSPN